MPSKRVVVTPPMLADVPGLFDPLVEQGLQVEVNPGPYPLDDRALADLVGDAWAALIGLDHVSAAFLAACPGLRLVARNGVGMDTVDLDAATERGVLVTAPFGANSVSVAELTIGLLICLARGVVPNHHGVQQGQWRRLPGLELAGRTLGIVGLGRIGQRVALRAQALEMQVVANDIAPDTAFAARHGVPLVDKDDLWARSDVISLHVPLTPLTHGLVNADTLGRMRPGVLLVNTARGLIVDSAALADALDRGHVAGAALDVHAQEGRADAVLLGRPNVITTTHLGSYTHAALRRTAEAAVWSILDLHAGRRPEGLVNPDAWRRYEDTGR